MDAVNHNFSSGPTSSKVTHCLLNHFGCFFARNCFKASVFSFAEKIKFELVGRCLFSYLHFLQSLFYMLDYHNVRDGVYKRVKKCLDTKFFASKTKVSESITSRVEVFFAALKNAVHNFCCPCFLMTSDTLLLTPLH